VWSLRYANQWFAINMRTLAILLLCCFPVLTGNASDVQVITTTTTNVASSSVITVDVFTRNGHTNLVRQTKAGDGGVHVLLQRFYHDGSLVGELGGVGNNNRAFAAVGGSSYRVSFAFGPSGEIISALIATKDRVCVDAFGCTNGVLYPEDASGIEKAGAYLDAFKQAVVGSFPDSSKAPDRK
jgi:hypothetical protein